MIIVIAYSKHFIWIFADFSCDAIFPMNRLDSVGYELIAEIVQKRDNTRDMLQAQLQIRPSFDKVWDRCMVKCHFQAIGNIFIIINIH